MRQASLALRMSFISAPVAYVGLARASSVTLCGSPPSSPRVLISRGLTSSQSSGHRSPAPVIDINYTDPSSGAFVRLVGCTKDGRGSDTRVYHAAGQEHQHEF